MALGGLDERSYPTYWSCNQMNLEDWEIGFLTGFLLASVVCAVYVIFIEQICGV